MMINKENLKIELKELVTFLFLSGGIVDNYHYYYNATPSFDDFNKEIFHPGYLDQKSHNRLHSLIETYANNNGITLIRSDDNFWVESVLPYKFKDLSIQEIVHVLWPNLSSTAIYHGDASDIEYWKNRFGSIRRRLNNRPTKNRKIKFT